MKDSIRAQKVLIDGHNLYYRYRPGTSDQYLCFLHGYPTSSLDFAHLMDGIPETFHVVAHDHLGFGRSDKPPSHSYALTAQADLALGLYKQLGAQRIHLVAHDYGTSVATEIVARDNVGELECELCTITLCNGSMLIDMAQLRLIQRLLKSRWVGGLVARLSSASTFHRNMRNIWYDKDRYQREEMQEHWDLLVSDGGKKVLPAITRYIDQRYTYYDRWIGGLKASRLPFHILWAANDPVAVVDMAYKLDEIITDSTLTIMEECGHYPMIERGHEWLEKVLTYVVPKATR